MYDFKINEETIEGVESAIIYFMQKFSGRRNRKKNNSYLEQILVTKIHFKRSLLTPIKKRNF